MSDLLVFIIYGFCLLANFADLYTTTIGLQRGLAEANPIARWLIKKNWAVAGFLKVGIIPLVGVVLDIRYSHGWFNGIIGAGVAYVAIKNYLLLRKSKISLK